MFAKLHLLQATAQEKDTSWLPVLGKYTLSFHRTNGRNYFAGNSLGLQPKGFGIKLANHARIWGYKQHDGHFEQNDNEYDRPWWRYQEKLVRIGSRLLGAHYDENCPEVAFLNTLSVNNRNLIETFAMYQRNLSEGHNIIPTIITIKSNFPSDDVGLKYALKIVFGKKHRLVEFEPEADGKYNFNQLVRMVRNESNVIMGFFPGLCYVTGQRFPIKKITEALHSVGAVAGFDLAHSVGNYQLNLHDENVDFATFCGYKYLNGGPGAVGGIFVHKKWFSVSDFEYVSGWFGIHKDDRFNFNPDNYRPAPGVWGFLQSNCQIFNMQGVEAFFDLVEAYGEDNIFKKHEEISTFLIKCLKCIPGIKITTPLSFVERGCQISFTTEDMDVDELLKQINEKNFCEKRGNNTIRVTAVGYNTFSQVWEFCNYLNEIMTTEVKVN